MEYTDEIVKALLQGGLTSLASVYYVLNTSNENIYIRIPMLNRTLPVWAVAGALGTISSFASDGMHKFIKKEIPINAKAQDEASLVLGALMSGGLFAGALYLTNPSALQEYGLINALAVGGGSELASSFITNMIYE